MVVDVVVVVVVVILWLFFVVCCMSFCFVRIEVLFASEATSHVKTADVSLLIPTSFPCGYTLLLRVFRTRLGESPHNVSLIIFLCIQRRRTFSAGTLRLLILQYQICVIPCGIDNKYCTDL